MKRTKIRSQLRPGVLVLVMAGIYVFGLILCIAILCYMPSGLKRARLFQVADTMVTEYLETGDANPLSFSGRAVLVYDSDGNLLYYYLDGARLAEHDFVGQGQKELPSVLEGKSTCRLVLFVEDDSELGYTSLVYVGVPILTDGEITGMLVWVRELYDLLETILGFVCAFTIVYFVAAVFMLLSMRSQHRYEQMRRHYIDNVTHELKTPIASIKALAEALSDDMEKSPADRSVYYGMILREANRQERMICDVLELSKLQSSQNIIALQPVDADQIFRPTCEKYAVLCDLMGVKFTVADEIRTLPELYTDKKYLPVVLDVLLGNALKFVQEGGCIQVSAELSRRHAVICVRDNGKGISKEDLPHIFERFYKGNRSDNEAGSGLGLAIAREIVDSMGERIQLRSREGEGTEAIFTVALRRTPGTVRGSALPGRRRNN